MNKIKKALAVLRSNSSNNIIKTDMLDVLDAEFMHLTNSMDMACKHNEEFIEEMHALRSLEDSYDDQEQVLAELLLRLNKLCGT